MAKNQALYREAQLEHQGVDENARTVPLTLSTEYPVNRGSFDEILSHAPGDVDLSRAPLPLIVAHDDSNLPIGRIDSLQLVGRKLRGLARFAGSAKALEVFADVRDGFVSAVSVGYRYLDDGIAEGARGLRFRWQPIEASAVAIGADPNAGFLRKATTMQVRSDNGADDGSDSGRASRAEKALALERRMKDQFSAVPADDAESFRGYVQDLAVERGLEEFAVLRALGQATKAYEAWRTTTIRELATMWQDRSDAAEIKRRAAAAALNPRVTVATFRQELLEMIATKSEINTGALEADRLEYGAAARVYANHGPLQCFKGPNAARDAHFIGMYIRGLAGDVKSASWVAQNTRTMTEGNFGQGGAFVPADMLANAIINNVDTFGIARRFAKLWPMTTATLSVPTNLEGLTISAVGENTATPTSDLSTSQVGLVAKEFAGGVRISNSLLEDSPIAIADFCVAEFARAVAKMEDQAVFTADGTSTYGGITGILWRVVNVAAAAGAKYSAASLHDTFAEIDLADLTAAMAKLPEYARKNAKWYCSASAKDAILTRLAAAAGGNNVQTVQGGVGEAFLGYPIVTGSVLPSDTTATYNGTPILLFGDLARSTAFGDRRSIDVAVDPSIYRNYRQTYVQLTSRFDVVNHMHGTSATVCGPMVALLGKT